MKNKFKIVKQAFVFAGKFDKLDYDDIDAFWNDLNADLLGHRNLNNTLSLDLSNVSNQSKHSCH